MTSEYGKLYLKEEIEDLNNIKIADILFFHRQSKQDSMPKIDNKYPGHCGIYLGDNKFINCTRTKKEVVISTLKKEKYWYNILVGSKDIITNKKYYNN